MGDFGWLIIVAIGWMVFGTAREMKKAVANAAKNAKQAPQGARNSAAAAKERTARRNAELREAMWAIAGERSPAAGGAAKPEFVEDTTSYDTASIEVAHRRRAAAELRNTGRGAGDHAAFDARIRQEPADHTAVVEVNQRTMRLREAFVWREILGPPVSMRDDS